MKVHNYSDRELVLIARIELLEAQVVQLEKRTIALELGKAIRKARHEVGKTMRDFARFLNVSVSQISAWETGYLEPKIHRIVEEIGRSQEGNCWVVCFDDGSVGFSCRMPNWAMED